ncbi:hypothetical protein LTR85_003070 [Meristemomyces frigidus]|nr:hypothetical protein LTR85_003070 [Meristemomyces frigidus]
MANPEKVTVDKAYFDALLRRADFHTSAQLLGRPDPANVTVSKVEYDSLLRISREYELLKSALFQGGITAETLDLLISGASNTEVRKDSGISATNPWTDDFNDQLPSYDQFSSQANVSAPYRDAPWRTGTLPAPAFNLAPGSGSFRNGGLQNLQVQAGAGLRVPSFQRQTSYGAPPSSVPDEGGFEDDDDFIAAGAQTHGGASAQHPSNDRRTLYFSGFSEQSTYRDLLSVIKGGKILSVTLRPERSATVTMLDGAEAFLAWAKRHDIYMHSKRIEVKWADRQYRMNGHIQNKILNNGATRNILVRNAFANGLTEPQLRADMEHIHNLIIIDIQYRNGDAYMSTNSVHNALFARTCMMSRTTYKGCKVEFFPDECDIPLPAPTFKMRAPPPEAAKKNMPLANRFDLLKMAGGDDSSDEENRMPDDRASDDDETIDMTAHHGVSLNFLDSDGTKSD